MKKYILPMALSLFSVLIIGCSNGYSKHPITGIWSGEITIIEIKHENGKRTKYTYDDSIVFDLKGYENNEIRGNIKILSPDTIWQNPFKISSGGYYPSSGYVEIYSLNQHGLFMGMGGFIQGLHLSGVVNIDDYNDIANSERITGSWKITKQPNKETKEK